MFVVQDYLLTSCTPSGWEYGSNDVTDQTPETIVEEIVRERIFQHLDKEIPYVIKQVRPGKYIFGLSIWTHLFC